MQWPPIRTASASSAFPYILSAKPIAVSEKGTLSLLPTRLTVAHGRLSSVEAALPLHAGSPNNKYTRQFIEFALSKKGQDVVGASGFVAQNVTQVAQTVSEDAPDEYKRLTKNANRLSLDFRFQSGQTDPGQQGQSRSWTGLSP